MYSTNRFASLLKKAMLFATLSVSSISYAEIDTHEIGDMGYLRTPMESANGLIVTNNRYSEIYTLKNNKLTPILQGRNCGLYTNMSHDGKLIGFKTFNEFDQQAPAILDVTTGAVTILDEFVHECGQVSFSNDGAIAYTMGNRLIVRKGNDRRAFDLGFYTNIANISPDGTQVAYSNLDGRMFIINLNTGAKENLAIQDGYRPVWSPDGSKIAVHVTNGTLSVYERASKKVYKLGEGESASWANNSEELIFTKTERINEMQIKGNTIQKVNFDGSNAITLVALSENMPTDAILTSDNKLITSYKTGIKRGLAMKNLTAGITPSATTADEIPVLTINEEDLIGARLPDPEDNPNIKPSIIPAEGTIGALDIPYLSQIYDVPATSSGCTKYGYVACAPTSASMYLGYYGLLNKVATTSRYDGKTDYYAYHVGRSYTNQKGTKTFSATANGNGCSGVAGGYGYMWNTGSPRTHFTDYMTLNGCTSSTMQWSASSAWSKFRTEVAAGRPLLLCIALESSGHLILGFRTNCTYTTAGGFVTRTGSFVCHDPYGDCNDSKWADGDGQHSSYDWIGYNSGRANIGTFYYSCSAVPPTTAVTPSLKCNPTSITLEGEVGSSEVKYVDVKVTGENLTTALSVASATSAITVSKLSGWDDYKGGTLRLTLNTNFSKGAGTYESYVAVQSTSNYRVEIKTSVTLTGTTDPSQGSTTDVISSLTEKWNYSLANGKTADWITYGSQVTQDMTFRNGKLYVVDKNAAAIYIVDAYTGAKIGALNTSSCSGGAHTLSAVEALGNSIIACNLTNNTSVNLKIYKWTSDNAEPTVMLDAALPAARLGDAMSVSGNETDGKIWFVNGSIAYYYIVKNGAITSTTPTTIKLTKDGSDFATANSSSYANVTVESDGSFWVAYSNLATTHFSSTGAYIESLALADNQGTDYKSFTLGSKKYAIATSYLKLATPSGATSATLADGAFSLMNITNGISSATTIGTYPSSGLGNIRNTSFRNSLCYEVTSTHVNVWILVPFQGAAYYSFQHTVPGTTTEVPEAELSATPASATLECKTNETAFTNITVTGKNIHEAIKVISSSDVFTVVDNTTYNSTDLSVSGTIQVIFKPSTKGNYNGTITITGTDGNGTDKSIAIAVSGIAEEANGVQNENVTALTEVWNYSQATNNNGGWVTFPTQATNDMTYKDGKLYVVNRDATGACSIYIINAYTGVKEGEISTDDCTESSTHTISGIEAIGDKIIACNLQTNIANPLVVYIWNNDNATPTKLLETTNRPVARIGDALSVSGDLNDGRLWFVNDSTVFFYPITNGVCSTTPTTVKLTKDGKAYNISPTYSFNVTVEENGSFWISSKDYTATHFTTDGVFIEELSADIIGNKQGTDLKFINLGNKRYAIATTYLNSSATSLANGAFTLIDVTNEGTTSGISLARKIATYPSAGLGTTQRNTSFRSSLCYEVNGEYLNVWVLVPMQGAAYYRFQHSENTSVENIINNDDVNVIISGSTLTVVGTEVARIDIYSIAGALCASEVGGNTVNVDALSGMYIVVITDADGNKTTHKILL